jgi:hypothetical protein
MRSLRRWWRRGLAPRVAGASQGVESAVRSLPGRWRQLRALGLTLAASLTKR